MVKSLNDFEPVQDRKQNIPHDILDTIHTAVITCCCVETHICSGYQTMMVAQTHTEHCALQVAELREICKQEQIKGYSKLNKGDLVRLMQQQCDKQ